MMMRSLGVGLVLSALSAVSGLAAQTQAEPHELVRTLQRVQDRIAGGSMQAHKAQRKLLQHISKRFAEIEPEAWSEARNGRAAITYLLSGGNPKIGRRIHKAALIDEADRKLLAAALAYVEGRNGRALRLMGDIDPLALPASLGGHVALVKAALYQNDDPKKSMGLLDTARLLMPGTLIEESALRRGMAAAGKQGDIDRFESLAGQYIHRYTMSVYRRDFDDKFSRYLIKLSYLDKPERRAKLERLLADMQPDRRRTLYLNVARSSLVGGQTEYAVYAAGHAEALSADRPKTLNQARTYKAAAALVTGELMPAVATLNALDVSMLPRRDREIAQAALRLAGEITRQPVLGDEMAMAPSQDGKGGEPGMDAAADDVVARAEKLIADVDQILAESEQ